MPADHVAEARPAAAGPLVSRQTDSATRRPTISEFPRATWTDPTFRDVAVKTRMSSALASDSIGIGRGCPGSFGRSGCRGSPNLSRTISASDTAPRAEPARYVAHRPEHSGRSDPVPVPRPIYRHRGHAAEKLCQDVAGAGTHYLELILDGFPSKKRNNDGTAALLASLAANAVAAAFGRVLFVGNRMEIEWVPRPVENRINAGITVWATYRIRDL